MNKVAFMLASAVALTLGTGAIAYAETPAGPMAAMTRAEVESQSAKAFERMDANNDGVLDKRDRELARAERQKAMFEKLDANHDGSISRAEFDSAGERLAERGDGPKRGPGAGKMRGMARHADGDGDKAVTQAEFTAAALERFARADADHNGTVTADERRAAAKAFRDQRRAPRAERQS